jgi:hypothetical protein
VRRGEIEFAVRNGRPRHLAPNAQTRPEQHSTVKAAA